MHLGNGSQKWTWEVCTDTSSSLAAVLLIPRVVCVSSGLGHALIHSGARFMSVCAVARISGLHACPNTAARRSERRGERDRLREGDVMGGCSIGGKQRTIWIACISLLMSDEGLALSTVLLLSFSLPTSLWSSCLSWHPPARRPVPTTHAPPHDALAPPHDLCTRAVRCYTNTHTTVTHMQRTCNAHAHDTNVKEVLDVLISGGRGGGGGWLFRCAFGVNAPKNLAALEVLVS